MSQTGKRPIGKSLDPDVYCASFININVTRSLS